MPTIARFFFSALLALLILAPAAQAQIPVPALSGRVVDSARMLSPSASLAIASSLEALEREKGAQIAVLTIPSLEGEPPESFSVRAMEAWKLGRKGVDDGVLLLVSAKDRKIRIEVGYGLEGAIPDAIAKRIIDEIITPAFKRGDYEGGVKAGAEALSKIVRGESLPPPPSTKKGISGYWVLGILFVLVLLGILFGDSSGGSGGTGGSARRPRSWGSHRSSGSSSSSRRGGGFSGGGGRSGGGGASGGW